MIISSTKYKADDPSLGMKPLAVSVKTGRALIDVGNTKMWELIKDGRVETFRIGRKRLIVYASLEKLVKSP